MTPEEVRKILDGYGIFNYPSMMRKNVFWLQLPNEVDLAVMNKLIADGEFGQNVDFYCPFYDNEYILGFQLKEK